MTEQEKIGKAILQIKAQNPGMYTHTAADMFFNYASLANGTTSANGKH